MSEFFDALTDKHIAFVERQPVFFVATAAEGARINLSPKGMDSFRVLSPSRVAYLDVQGASGRSCPRHDLNSAGRCLPDAGNETNAHLIADGRMTIMFCAFDNPALIFRIYGRGRAILPQDADWADYARHFTLLPGTRQIFEVTVDQVQTSCGWGVPHMSFERERDTLSKYHLQHGEDERQAKYAVRLKSIDGLPVRNPTQAPQQQQQ